MPDVLLDGEHLTLDNRERVARHGAVVALDPAVGILLLECTNLSPYSRTLSEAFGYPVFDVIEVAHLLYRTGCRDEPFNRGMWC